VDLEELEGSLESLERELLEINANNERLERNYDEYIEMEVVLKEAGGFFDDARSLARQSAAPAAALAPESLSSPLLAGAASSDAVEGQAPAGRLGFAVGLVSRESRGIFERVLFRATRGNLFFQHRELDMQLRDPQTREMTDKAVFVVFFAGDRARTKVMKICDAFGASRYPFPEQAERRSEMAREVFARSGELASAINAASTQRRAMLNAIARDLDTWVGLVKREKAIYHTLNKLSVDVTHKALIAEAWCPVEAKPRVHAAVVDAASRSPASVGTVFQALPTREEHPTHFRTNKWTGAFQNIVDAYGVARYREVNPTVFTIVTFPFLFAVMFGDFAHGLLMVAFAAFLVYREKQMGKQKLNEMIDMAFGGRYVILLMGIFSVFAGLIYNEAFSMPLTIFGKSHYECAHPLEVHNGFRLCPGGNVDGLVRAPGTLPYPVGVDPIWHGTRTELPFVNGFKMKMSIVMGVAHMSLGVFMSLFNHLYFGDSLSVWCQFVPEILFLWAMFGYLVMLIIAKWVTGSTIDLYHVLIQWFLTPGNVDCGGECPENKLFEGQGAVQNALLLLMFVCVPWMLLPKPLILKKRHERAQALGNGPQAYLELETGSQGEVAGGDAGSGGGGGHGGHGGHGDGFEFGEVFVHQMIHTIEFVLGAISNTASYLRLWALSLAHAQLSAVFYDRVLVLGLQQHSVVVQLVGTVSWWCASLGVLMVMETLSAFLHALRLHWVEFQNKFYHGDGYKFVPFSLADADKEEL